MGWFNHQLETPTFLGSIAVKNQLPKPPPPPWSSGASSPSLGLSWLVVGVGGGLDVNFFDPRQKKTGWILRKMSILWNFSFEIDM